MTTATGDVVFDFKLDPDVENYTNPDLYIALDYAQTNEIGLLNSQWTTSPRIVLVEQTAEWNVAKASEVERNTTVGESGPGLYTLTGDGYEYKAVYDEMRLYKVTAWQQNGTISGQVNLDTGNNALLRLEITEAGELTALANGVDVGFGSIIDTTYPASSLRPGTFSNRESSGAAGVLSFAGIGLAVDVGVLTVEQPMHVGSPSAITTQGMGTLTVDCSIGGASVDAVDAPDGQGTITPASFVEDNSYPRMGSAVPLEVTDGVNFPPSFPVELDTMVGWQYVNAAFVDTGPWSLGKAFLGDDEIVPDQVHVIDDGVGVLLPNLTLQNWALGSYTAWVRSLSNGHMYSFAFVVTAGGTDIVRGLVNQSLSASSLHAEPLASQSL